MCCRFAEAAVFGIKINDSMIVTNATVYVWNHLLHLVQANKHAPALVSLKDYIALVEPYAKVMGIMIIFSLANTLDHELHVMTSLSMF
jgi:hypothetical protein